MKIRFRLLALGLLVGYAIVQITQPAQSRAQHELIDQAAPEFTQSTQREWLNSVPLTLTELRGQVVVMEFWTSECTNCLHNVAWMKALQERFAGRPVAVIGVHTPEFEYERDRQKVAAKAKQLKLDFPIMIDNDYAYWNAMHNLGWPSVFIIDKFGIIRNVYLGVTQVGGSQSRRMATMISRLAKQAYPVPE